MVELRSRTGNERPGRPCPRAALSGRRAAQDGLRHWPGGPERAAAKGSGETPSAGRAAAPCQFQVETLGRGRSAVRVARALAEHAKPAELVGLVEARPCERAGSPFQAMVRVVFFALAAVGLLNVSAAAQTFVHPGQTGVTLTVEIENASDSGADIASAQVTVPNPDAVVTNIQVSPAAAVAIGQTKTFTVTFDVATSIPSTPDPYTFTVTLHDNIDDAVDPDPAAQDIVVSFATLSPSAVVERVV